MFKPFRILCLGRQLTRRNDVAHTVTLSTQRCNDQQTSFAQQLQLCVTSDITTSCRTFALQAVFDTLNSQWTLTAVTQQQRPFKTAACYTHFWHFHLCAWKKNERLRHSPFSSQPSSKIYVNSNKWQWSLFTYYQCSNATNFNGSIRH